MNEAKGIDLDEAAFQQRAVLKSHLAYESFLALARKPGRELIVDCSMQRRAMKGGLMLAISHAVSKRISEWSDKKRVGIVFPPGLGGYIANLAVTLSGKVPVNLNFTLGPSSIASCIQRAEIDCILTTKMVEQKMPNFPWPESGIIDLVEEMKRLPKRRVLALFIAMHISPAKCLANWLKIPSVGDREEAGLLFTSGSSGEPKGVALTHRNILANCEQIDAAGLIPASERVVANLPIFHSFGFTVTLWYPLLRGCSVVTLPSPLEVKKIAEAIHTESATVLIGTPTFLKPYLKRVAPEKLASIQYVIAGAEKTPAGFAEAWTERFGGQYMEGYGLTETSPVVSVNLPGRPKGVNYPGTSEEGSRAGSVGRMMPGQAARILDPETMEALSPESTGLLAVKGPNIFEGYLGDPERTAEVKDGDWFITGDLARFDEDGFLFIEGRLSRFSKIGGEMVPHGTVEQALIEAYGLLDSEAPMLAVAARPDEAKGEALVLIAAIDLELSDLREKLTAKGFANLWIPKEIRRVDEVPTLATGKLDLRGIQELACSD